MRIVFSVILSLHALIHLMGFLKAYEVITVDTISQPIPRAYGIVWLLAFLLFALTLLLFLRHVDYWWISAFVGVLISQFLILIYWNDAKYGSLINLFVLVWTIVGYMSINFGRMVYEERHEMLQLSKNAIPQLVTHDAIAHLPEPVGRWLTVSGVVGRPVVNNVYLEQQAMMRLKPEQKDWHSATANQLFTLNPPSFNWSVELQMGAGMEVVGRDKLENGEGEMLIKLFSTIPLANEKRNPKIDQASLQRFLAEIVWFPWGALSPYISWSAIDANSAMATLEFEGTTGNGIFHFAENGEFEKFTALRYMDKGDHQPTPWVVVAKESKQINGIRVPVDLSAVWQLEDQDWTWLKLMVTDIQYDIEDLDEVSGK